MCYKQGVSVEFVLSVVCYSPVKFQHTYKNSDTVLYSHYVQVRVQLPYKTVNQLQIWENRDRALLQLRTFSPTIPSRDAHSRSFSLVTSQKVTIPSKVVSKVIFVSQGKQCLCIKCKQRTEINPTDSNFPSSSRVKKFSWTSLCSSPAQASRPTFQTPS